MNELAQLDLIEMFRAFLSHYPSMRFGQAVCAVGAWENDDPTLVSDESLASSLRENLEIRFDNHAYDLGNSSMSAELATALREAHRLNPTVPLGKLLAPLLAKNNWNIYDLENDDLLVALQAEISNAAKSRRGEPITA